MGLIIDQWNSVSWLPKHQLFHKGTKMTVCNRFYKSFSKTRHSDLFFKYLYLFYVRPLPCPTPSVSFNQVNFFKPEQFRKSFKIYLWKLFKKKILNKEKLGLIHEIMLEHAKYIILRLLSFIVAEPMNDMPSVPVLNAAKTNIVDGSCSSDFTSR